MIETKVTGLLDREGVAYRVLLHSEPVFTVEAAAAQRGVAAGLELNPQDLIRLTGAQLAVISKQ